MAVVINGTTGITSVNGSAAAPSVTGTDTDTGIVYGTNTLSLATGGTTAVTIGSDQSTTLAGTLAVQSQNMTPYTSFKNRIINGAMVVNQRATSRALTSTEEYVIDRWAAPAALGSVTPAAVTGTVVTGTTSVVAANGVFVNSATVSTDLTIGTGQNGFSVGPLTVNSGVTLTVASGQRHIVL